MSVLLYVYYNDLDIGLILLIQWQKKHQVTLCLFSIKLTHLLRQIAQIYVCSPPGKYSPGN